jgi:hypothetical protein
MLSATEREVDHVQSYMASQAPDLTVEFLQKVYVENVGSVLHAVWDVHTNKDRWWVITNPTNLYSQDRFPNMDYALTFHVGLCIRNPRAEAPKISDLPIEPFAASYRALSDVNDALRQVSGVADYQAVGVKYRETLLSFVTIAQPASRTVVRAPRAPAMIVPNAKHNCNVKITALLLGALIYTACSVRPQTEPLPAQLVGKYVLTKMPAACRSKTGSASRLPAEVELSAGGSFKIDGLPSCFADDHGPATTLAGTIAGQWSVTQIEGDYVLELLVTSGPLQHGWNLGVEIRGRTPPFELYFVVGDPDQRAGLVFNRI